jgi:hypothetical protein
MPLDFEEDDGRVWFVGSAGRSLTDAMILNHSRAFLVGE